MDGAASTTGAASTVTSPPARGRVPAGRSILANFGFLTGGRLLADLCTFLLFVTLSRGFGQEGIGHYAFAIAFTGLFAVCADFGLYRYSVKHWGRDVGAFRRPLGRILVLRFVLVPSLLAALIATVHLLDLAPALRLVVLVVGVHQIGFSLANGLLAAFVAHEESHLSALLDLLAKAATAVVGIALALSGASLPIVLTAMPAMTIALTLVALAVVVRRYGRPATPVPLAELWATLCDALPYWLSTLGRNVAIRADVILLSLLIGAAAAGTYNAAHRVVFLLMFLPYLAAAVILPRAARLHGADRSRLVALYESALGAAILVGVPATVGLSLIAPQLIDRIFGAEFAAAAPLLRILALLVLLSCLRHVVSTFLTASDREAARTKREWAAAAAGIATHLILIPPFGALGAALATVAMESLLLVLIVVQLH